MFCQPGQYPLSSACSGCYWQEVSLPHTWNAKDGQDGGGDYYRGTGMYKRTFSLGEELTDKKVYLHIDGATTTARVL